MIPSTIKIDVTKIAKEHLYRTPKAIYLDAAIWENKNGPDEYGNTHYITQSVSKESRAAGIKGAIIGNVKLVQEERQAPRQQARPAPKQPINDDAAEDDIPF